jgi:hypothetical protein
MNWKIHDIRRILHEKGKLILGWVLPLVAIYLFLCFIGQCSYFTLHLFQQIFLLFRTKLHSNPTQLDLAGQAFASAWVFLMCSLVYRGFWLGKLVMTRLYTREEMFEILAGPLRSKPLSSERAERINQTVNRMYPE